MKPNYFYAILKLAPILFISGCAANLWVQSDPPGAYAVWPDGTSKAMPVNLQASWTSEYQNGGCMNVLTTAAVWPDGYRMQPESVQLCHSKGNVFNYVFRRPKAEVGKSATSSSSVTPNVTDLSEAKKKCGELGFKLGTDDFGKCVLQLSK